MAFSQMRKIKDTASEFSCLLLWQKKAVAKIITINTLNSVQIKKATTH